MRVILAAAASLSLMYRENAPNTDMLHPKITDSASLDLSCINGIFNCPPTFQSTAFPTIGAVEKEQVDVFEAALLQRIFDGSARVVIVDI